MYVYICCSSWKKKIEPSDDCHFIVVKITNDMSADLVNPTAGALSTYSEVVRSSASRNKLHLTKHSRRRERYPTKAEDEAREGT